MMLYLHHCIMCSKGQLASSYPSKPYPLTQEQTEEEKQDLIEEEQAKAKVWMTNFVNAYQ